MAAVYGDEYATGSVNMDGPETLGTYSVADIGGDSVAQYTDVRGIEILPAAPITIHGSRRANSAVAL